MGDRRTAMDDLFEICAMLPWWIGVTVAVISYFTLHQYAVVELVNTGDPAKLISDSVIQSLAKVMQYIVPLVCLGGSLISFIKRKV